MKHDPLPRLIVVAACITLLTSAAAAQPKTSTRNQEARALATHVLNRLTFGPRPGDVDRVLGMGVERWIDRQLQPETIVDKAGLAALKGCPIWTEPLETALELLSESVSVPTMTASGNMARASTRLAGVPLITRDSARKLRLPSGGLYLENGQLMACRLARVEASDQQLLEVMTDFWENHFSVYGRRFPTRGSVVQWDRGVIRPNALGRFRHLLGEVARSPAMLGYLDNATSSASAEHHTLTEYVRAQKKGTAPEFAERPAFGAQTGLNENFGRELLELHTLGVNGGYTQADVIAVSRAFTGWSHTGLIPRLPSTVPPPRMMINGFSFGVVSYEQSGEHDPGFAFDPDRHDAGAKMVLGRTLAAGRGIEDGDDVLDILARHPSTARHIARKLAVRFVSDSPPDALVERAAARFLSTDGDIREVVRTIVTSPEFFSPAVYGAKVKSPLEFVLSARRALAAPVDTLAEVIDLLITLEQPPFGYPTPEGWPETAPGWLSTAALIARMNLAVRIGQGELPSIPLEMWPEWKSLARRPSEEQVEGVIQTLLQGRASADLRRVLAGSRPTSGNPKTSEARTMALRRLIVLTIGSPEFQRR